MAVEEFTPNRGQGCWEKAYSLESFARGLPPEGLNMATPERPSRLRRPDLLAGGQSESRAWAGSSVANAWIHHSSKWRADELRMEVENESVNKRAELPMIGWYV